MKTLFIAVVIAAWFASLYIAISWTHIKREWKQWRTRRTIRRMAHETTNKGLRQAKRWPR